MEKINETSTPKYQPIQQLDREQTQNMSLLEIELFLVENQAACLSCGKPMALGEIRTYDHAGGWPVKDFPIEQWVFMLCSKCGYGTALWKLLRWLGHRQCNFCWETIGLRHATVFQDKFFCSDSCKDEYLKVLQELEELE